MLFNELVEGGDVLVGKISPQPESENTPEGHYYVQFLVELPAILKIRLIAYPVE